MKEDASHEQDAAIENVSLLSNGELFEFADFKEMRRHDIEFEWGGKCVVDEGQRLASDKCILLSGGGRQTGYE